MMNRENELPEGWVWVRIEEICEVETGTTPSKSKAEYYGKDYRFYKPTDLDAGYYTRDSRDGLSTAGLEEARLLPKRSVLVTCIGATIGKTGFIRQEGASNQQINAIIPYQGISPEYVYFICISPQFQRSIIQHASATTLPILSKRKFEILVLPIPPLPEQYRIAAKIEELFTRLDAGVEALKKAKAQLKHYRQAILKNAFEGKLTEEWREAHKGQLEPASVLLERVREERKNNAKGKVRELPPLNTSDLTELPEGWVWARIGDIMEPSDEKVDPMKTEKMPYIGLEHIEKDSRHLLSYGYSSQVRSTKTRFYSGDLLYGKLRPYLNKVYVPDFEGICSTDILVFPKSCYIPNKFLSYRFLCGDFVRYASRNVSGVQHPRVNFNTLAQFVVSLPSLPEQHKIVEEVERHFSITDEIEKVVEQSLKQAERLRQSILKRAFEGKLVPQDPTDEPAEKLLEHIRAERARIEAEKKATGKTRRS